MTVFQAIILGIVQGLTEFLPISSSGHLVLVPKILGWDIPTNTAFVFDVLVQLGTLLAVIVYFWKDLQRIGSSTLSSIVRRDNFSSNETRMGIYLILATIPAGIAGLLLKDTVEAAFSSPLTVARLLVVTAALLFAAERAGKRKKSLEQIDWKDAIFVGIFQALALFPGISRSGASIAGGMARDMERSAAARFSFLIAVPIMLAAGLVATLDMLQAPNLDELAIPVLAGFLSSAVVGYFAIHWFLEYLAKNRLTPFIYYLIILSLIFTSFP